MSLRPQSSSHLSLAVNRPLPETAAFDFGGDDFMTDVIFKLRVSQLVGTLRSRPMPRESETMLGMLESLVVAGEIPFSDFMQRVQNLFPDVFDAIEPDLRARLMSMLVE